MSEEQMTSVECTETEISEVISSQEPIIHLTENGVVGFEVLCRLCANRSDHLIPIYSEEGISNDLADKMNLYLPVKVAKTDLLPLQCCFQCASTVLTWHELVIASVEADKRLRDVQAEVEKQLAEHEAEIETENEAGPSQSEHEKIFIQEDRLIIPDDASLNPFRQEKIEQLYKSEPDAIAPATKKRGRTPKNKAAAAVAVTAATTTSPNAVKVETAEGGEFQTTDGSWIKTELVLESDEVAPFIENCDMEAEADADEQEQEMKLDNTSDNSDFDELDPDYSPESDSGTKLHVCHACGKYFRNISDYTKHEQMCENSEENEMMKIETLDDDSSEEYLVETKPKIDQKFKREYRCDYCVWVAVRKDDLRKHVQDAHPQHYASFNEKRQRKRSKIDQDAVNAAKVVVDSRTYYHCNECGKNLHSPYTYIWHNRIHTGERPFVCDLCGKQFRVSQGLVRHLRETHAGIKNFPCDLCGRMFATRRNVEEHRRIHTNERPYICDLCGKAFKQKASLFVHNRSHTDSFPFKCSYCNQGFRTRPPLLVHVTRHTGEKPYACDICGRCFRIKYELKRHRLIHSDDKPFSCTDCGLSFRQKRYLRNHNKTNHNRATP